VIVRTFSTIRALVYILIGLIVISIFFACLKAGTGVGLDADGAFLKIDSCKLVLAPARCTTIDSCTLPNAPAKCVTLDSCSLPNPPKHCVDCSKLPKSTACLDTAYFVEKVLPIFKTNCEKCHIKPGGKGFLPTKLSLESSDAWDSLVNIKADEITKLKKNMMRVLPGNPDSSYLYLKITQEEPPVGAMMPMEALSPLTPAQVDIIKTWIIGRK
jgi:hypothetical protein